MPLPAIIALLILLAACVPATTPPQLEHTPGPAVQVIDSLYESDVFRVQYPSGWRVITSAASSPVSVIFAAPDNDALILIGESVTEAPAPAGYDGALRSEQRAIRLENGAQLTATLNAAVENWESHLALFEMVIASIQSHDTA